MARSERLFPRASQAFWLGVGAAMIALVGACNFLVGLDKFDDGPCTTDCVGQLFDGGEHDAAPDVVTVPDGGSDVGTPPPVVLDTRRLWARWSVSDRDAGDARALDETGAVHDSVTGLTWELVATVQPSMAAAKAHCDGLRPRMVVPSRIELMTLLELRGQGGALVDPLFVLDGGADAGPDATAASLGASFAAENGYAVDFATGLAVHATPPAPFAVRCVRLEQTFPVGP